MENLIKKKLKNKKYKWVVTGSSGFIGTNIVKKLLEHNQVVIGIDIKHGKKFKKNFYFVKGNLLEKKILNKIPNKIDFVLHQASLTSVPESILSPVHYLNQNFISYVKLIQKLKKTKVKKLIYASSCAVYGNKSKKNLEKDTIIFNEYKNLTSAYSLSKKLIEDYSNTINCNFNLIGLRYFNVFGPHQKYYGKNLPVVSNWINLIAKNKKINIYGNGLSYRNYIYVDDVVNSNILAALLVNKNNMINICSSSKVNLNQLFIKLSNTLKKLKVNYHKKPIYIKQRHGDIIKSNGSNFLSKTILQFKESKSFNEALKATCLWQLKKLYKFS